MKIIDFNAAALFFEKIKSIRQSPGSWRCIYLHLSDSSLRYNRGLRTHFVFKALRELLAEETGFIYLCEDGDVIVLFQGPITPIIDKLASHFEDLKPMAIGLPPEKMQEKSLFSVFDLAHHWQSLYHLSKAKYLSLASEDFATPYLHSHRARPLAQDEAV